MARRPASVLGSGLVALALVAPASAGATTYTVRSHGDGLHGSCQASCTLRDAIDRANANPGPDRIVLGAGRYSLTLRGADEDDDRTGDLDVREGVTVIGRGAGRTTIDARNLDRAFDLMVDSSQLTLRGLAIVHAQADFGGCIRVVAGLQLSLQSVLLDHCRASDRGGAVGLSAGDANFLASGLRVVGARATNQGGGLYLQSDARVAISGSTITRSRGGAGAGLLRYGHGLLTIDRTRIADNHSTDTGGGFYIDAGDTGTVRLSRVVVSGNTAYANYDGGGRLGAHRIQISDSVFVGNRAGGGGGLELYGTGNGLKRAAVERTTIASNVATRGDRQVGGLDLGPQSLHTELRDVTVYGNAVAGQGGIGGIYVGGALTLRNTTISGNTAQYAGAIYADQPVTAANTIFDGDCRRAGPLRSLGGNIDRGLSCGLSARSDRSLTNPLLGAYGTFGGRVPTVSLQAGSPAIDHGTGKGCLKTDARGVRRPRDGNGDGRRVCDVGAFER